MSLPVNDQFPSLPDVRQNDPNNPTAQKPSGFPEANPTITDDLGVGKAAEGTRTLEDVEAEWANRMSGKDKAHAAEIKALKEQHAAELAAAGNSAHQLTEEARAKMTDAEALAAENATLKTSLEAERKGRVLDTRKAKFPAASESLGDDVVATMDEEKLTALEARLATPGAVPPPAVPLSNTAAKTGGDQPITEKTSADLIADLERFSPGFVADLSGGLPS